MATPGQRTIEQKLALTYRTDYAAKCKVGHDQRGWYYIQPSGKRRNIGANLRVALETLDEDNWNWPR